MSPWWLLLLAPVIVHWLNRGSGKTYPMGDLRFFDRHSPPQLRFYRPQRWLLLLTRLSLVAVGVLVFLQTLDPDRGLVSGGEALSSERGDSTLPQISTQPALAEYFESGDGASLVLADDGSLATSLLPADFDATSIRIVPPSSPPPTLRVGVDVNDPATRSEITDQLTRLNTVAQRPLEIVCVEASCEDEPDVWIVDEAASVSGQSWRIEWGTSNGSAIADGIYAVTSRTFALSEPNPLILDRVLRWIPRENPQTRAQPARATGAQVLGLLFALLLLAERTLAIRDEARGA